MIVKIGYYYSKSSEFIKKSKESYGSPRITKELNIKGFKASQARVVRLMKNNGIRAIRTKKLVIRSMSIKGNCWEDAIASKVAESFFKTLKVEHVYRQHIQTKQQTEIGIFQWIETCYNRQQRHSALGKLTIIELNNLNNIKKVA